MAVLDRGTWADFLRRHGVDFATASELAGDELNVVDDV